MPSFHSNGHGRFSPPDEVLSGRSAYSNRAGERSHHSPALTPLSSPHSASSSSKKGQICYRGPHHVILSVVQCEIHFCALCTFL